MSEPRIKIEVSWGEFYDFIMSLSVSKTPEEEKNIISRFETEFANRYGFVSGVVLPKARIAFYYLLRNMRLKPGGEVLISAIHVGDFINMILLAGFKPVVVDLEPDSYSISFEDLEKKLNHNSALILITHLYGYATDMDRVQQLSAKYSVPFIEDCSQSVNSFYKGKRLGTFGKAAIFSLSLIKPVCTMFGGMVVSSDEKLLETIKNEARNLAPLAKLPLFMETVKHVVLKIAVSSVIFRFVVFPLVRLTMSFGDYFAKYQKHNKTVILRDSMPKNYLVRYSWQQAQLGLCQLATLNQRGERKASTGQKLYDLLKNAKFSGLPRAVVGSTNSFWLFPLITADPERFKRMLAANGLDGSRMLLGALSVEESFSRFGFTAPNAEKLREKTVFIPFNVSFSDAKLAATCDAVLKAGWAVTKEEL